MIKKFFVSSAFLVACIILQSTVLRYLTVYDVIPNIYLIFLVYTAFYNGGLHGTTCGFISGLIEDVISISPLGFHALIKMIIGSLFSSFNGLVILDSLIMPMFLVTFATILNRVFAFGVISIFSLSVPVHSIFSKYFLIEIAYNTLLTPFLFFIADHIRTLYKMKGFNS